MKEIEYDKELMDQYIAQKWFDATCEPITEKDREILAESLDFNVYCLSVRWHEFMDALSKAFPIRLISKMYLVILVCLIVWVFVKIMN